MHKIQYLGYILLGTIVFSTAAQAETYSPPTSEPVRPIIPPPPQSTPAPRSAPAAPQPISAAKRDLIRQLLEMTGGRQQYEQTQRLILTQVQQQVQPMLEQAVSGITGISEAEKQALVERSRNSVNSFVSRLATALQTTITYDEMLEKVYYPVYDQYFTEADLQSLIAFYQTPIGRKLISVSPQLTQTSLQLTNQVFAPRIAAIFRQLLQEQMNQFQNRSPGRQP